MPKIVWLCKRLRLYTRACGCRVFVYSSRKANDYSTGYLYGCGHPTDPTDCSDWCCCRAEWAEWAKNDKEKANKEKFLTTTENCAKGIAMYVCKYSHSHMYVCMHACLCVSVYASCMRANVCICFQAQNRQHQHPQCTTPCVRFYRWCISWRWLSDHHNHHLRVMYVTFYLFFKHNRQNWMYAKYAFIFRVWK